MTRRDGPARRAVAAMTLATLLWGATFVVIRDILGSLGPFDLIFTRFAVAAVCFAILFAVRRPTIGRAGWTVGVLAGLSAAGGYLFQAIGLTTTSAGSSAFLTCTGTVFAAFFAWPLLGERPSAPLLQGIALALAGSALLSTRPGVFEAGDAWTLLGAVCYALQIIVVARGVAHTEARVIVAIQSLVIALVVLPFAGHAPERLAALRPADLMRLAYLAIGGSILAPLLQVTAQRTLPAGRVALLFALEPVFALLFALALGGERFGIRWFAGAGLILAGVLRVEWRSAPAGSSPSAASPESA